MRGRLNLATRRFGNERLPALGFGLACVVLLVVTVQQGVMIRRLLPGQSSALHREVAGLEEEAARLRSESAELRGVAQPDKTKVAEWQLVKDLVDRRVFRWTELFARLADSLPTDVRLTGITPAVRDGVVTLSVDAAVKSLEAGLAFIQKLEERPEFEDVYPKGVSKGRSGDDEFTYLMRYLGEGTAPAAAAPAAAKGAGR